MNSKMTMTKDQKRELIKKFMDAWERADAEAVMKLMSANCEYKASVGPEPGTSFIGRDEVERGVAEMLEFESGGESRQGRVWFSEDRAFAEWDYDDIADDGTVSVVRGIDIIHFADGSIESIDAYRKARH